MEDVTSFLEKIPPLARTSSVQPVNSRDAAVIRGTIYPDRARSAGASCDCRIAASKRILSYLICAIE